MIKFSGAVVPEEAGILLIYASFFFQKQPVQQRIISVIKTVKQLLHV